MVVLESELDHARLQLVLHLLNHHGLVIGGLADLGVLHVLLLGLGAALLDGSDQVGELGLDDLLHLLVVVGLGVAAVLLLVLVEVLNLVVLLALLIASAQAVVVKIKPNEVRFVCKINLPKLFHSKNEGWIGAVDNHGKHVALYHQENFKNAPREHTIGRTEATDMLIKEKRMLVNNVWLYD